jgi:hypothetical protein
MLQDSCANTRANPRMAAGTLPTAHGPRRAVRAPRPTKARKRPRPELHVPRPELHVPLPKDHGPRRPVNGPPWAGYQCPRGKDNGPRPKDHGPGFKRLISLIQAGSGAPESRAVIRKNGDRVKRRKAGNRRAKKNRARGPVIRKAGRLTKRALKGPRPFLRALRAQRSKGSRERKR